jgi:hypothetical protein
MPEEADPLRPLPVGGDRRSIARSNEALARLRADPTRIGGLVSLVGDDDPLVVRRAVDLIEKLAHERPEWIPPNRKRLIGSLAQQGAWEARLQIARALPLRRWTAAERKRAVAILLGHARRPQKLVKAWSVDGLSQLTAHDPSLLPVVEAPIEDFERAASPALTSRARRIRQRLRGAAVTTEPRGP